MMSAPGDECPSSLSIFQIEVLVMSVTRYPDLARGLQVIGAIRDSTSASEAGRDLVRRWAAALPTDVQDHVMEAWSLFRGEPNPQAGVASLCRLVEASGLDCIGVLDSATPGFVKCPFSVEYRSTATALDRFSLAGQLDALEEEAVEQVQILGGLALTGQITLFFASPNSGKTLLTLHGLIGSIEAGDISPHSIFYLNADDGQAGLIEKVKIAEANRFNMIADGFRGFSAKAFPSVVAEMVRARQCQGVVVVLDTAKKFVDTMSKTESSEFMRRLRQAALHGLTVIMLAHTNKKPGPDGAPIYAGTSDLVDDADCAYTLQVTSAPDASERRVLATCIKRRGDVRQRAVYTFSAESGIAYPDLLESVREVPDDEAEGVVAADQRKADDEMIAAAEDSIRTNVCIKKELVAAIIKRTGVSRRAALGVLDKYAGPDPTRHRWTFVVRERGAHVFSLLPGRPAEPGSDY